jgi:MFS family permease
VAVFAVSIFGGPLASRLGVRTLLIFGAATFSINGSSYYVNLKYKVQWWFVLGRTIYGLGFGAWYVAEAAIILSYPEEQKRGL